MDAPPPPDLKRLLEHTAFLHRVARGLLSNADDAEDVAQETWLRAVRTADRPVRQPRGWLRTVARNLARSKARGAETRARHAARLPCPLSEPSTVDVVAREELRRRVVRAVLALPDTYRRTLVLRYYEGLSLRQVAARTEVPLETTRTRIRRGLDRMRVALTEDDERRGAGQDWRGTLLSLSHQASPSWAAPVLGASVVLKGVGIALAVLVLGGILWSVLVGGDSRTGPASQEVGRLGPGEVRVQDGGQAPPPLRGRLRDAAVPSVAPDDPDPALGDARSVILVARDMFDGSICPGHQHIRWVMGEDLEGPVVEVTTDEQGRIAFDSSASEAGRLLPIPLWSSVCGKRQALACGTLWVFRTVELRAELEGERGDILFPGASLAARRIDSTDAARYRPVGLRARDHRRAFDLVQGLPKPRGDAHTLVLLLPRMRGVMVRASAPGHLDAWRLFDPAPDGGFHRMQFRLRPGPILQGQVRDDQGAPLGGVELLVRVVVPAPEPRHRLEQMMFGVGWDCYVAGGATDAHMRFELQTSVSDDGRFHVDLPIEGQITVRAWREGRVAVERALGVLPVGPTEVVLELPALRGPSPAHAALVTRGGKPLVRDGATIHVLKVEGQDVTRTWTLDIDHPRLPLAELERGSRYRVRRERAVGGEIVGDFVWDEVTPIVVGE